MILAGCNNELREIEKLPNSSQTFTQTSTTVIDYTKINNNMERVAIEFAKSLKSQEIRNLIKTEALEMFDGDYDILYKNLSLKKLANGLTFESHLSRQDDKIKNQVAEISKFQVSVPVHCESWDADNYIPLVAIAPQGIPEKEIKQIKAFDADGNVHFLDGQKSPDKPVIVLGASERTDINGNLLKGFKKGKNKFSNGRVENSQEYLGRIYCPDPSTYESWWLGALDLKLTVMGSQNGSVLKLIDAGNYSVGRQCVTELNDPNYSADDGCYLGDFLFSWNTSYGTLLTYHWTEWDTEVISGSIQVAVPVLGGGNLTATINIRFSDTVIGGWTVSRSDFNAQRYGSASSFQFQVFYPL
jgi:hypothetical protein